MWVLAQFALEGKMGISKEETVCVRGAINGGETRPFGFANNPKQFCKDWTSIIILFLIVFLYIPGIRQHKITNH